MLVQGGAIATLAALWKHHKSTIREHKKEREILADEHARALVVKDEALAAKDEAHTKALAAKNDEVKSREDACRAELAACYESMRELESGYRSKIEELLKDQVEHEGEMLARILNELKQPGGK